MRRTHAFLFIVSLALLAVLSTENLIAQSSAGRFHQAPFSVDETHITVWNGDAYVPLFIRGINLGVGVPGTFPGEMAATREQYDRWFALMHQAGFNTIRVYTLHYPRFYEALRDYNLANPNYPIYLFQGVWLEEEVPGYNDNLYTLTDLFEQEIRENISAVHGNIAIAERQGKAHGTFSADVSSWVIGYIIGREVHPPEVLLTNDLYPEITSYEGEYLSVSGVQASDAWVTARMDYVKTYNMQEYGTQRPVSFSSWPTLDPIEHPFDTSGEDIASIDISGVDFSRADAGIFASYHAYPYYPDYISRDPRYIPFTDHLGQNSYLGYLTTLSEYYNRFPLIIGEFGAPSSWGNAHFAHNGIHHGGYDERDQGKHAIRMFHNMVQSGTGGGMLFAWLDEWFKITWITDPMDFDPERRIVWHNVTAAEQNYGLLGFRRPDRGMRAWETFCADCPVRSVSAGADYAYLHLELEMDRQIGPLDSVWVSLDTYRADLGESVLPNGETVSNRAEFALLITNYKADLYVTEAYDTYGIWHGTSSAAQQYRSVPTDGAPWRLVRWKNNDAENEVQYIGSMQVNRLNLPQSSKDAVRLYDDRIEIRLPWTLLNVVDPSRAQVMHYERNVNMRQTLTTDGIHLSVFYRGESYKTTTRFEWENWNHALGAEEYKKESFFVVEKELRNLPGSPIAVRDHYVVGRSGTTQIPAMEGVLANDISADRTPMIAVTESGTRFGILNLRADGSFVYTPVENAPAEDSFSYRVRAGSHWSEPVTVSLTLEGSAPSGSGFVQVYPNPASGPITVRAASDIDQLSVYTVTGQLLSVQNPGQRHVSVDLSAFVNGVYFIQVRSGGDTSVKKVMLYQ